MRFDPAQIHKRQIRRDLPPLAAADCRAGDGAIGDRLARDQQEPDPVNVGEESPLPHRQLVLCGWLPRHLRQLVFTIEFRQLRDLTSVELGRGKSQLLLKCLLQNLNVFVLAKNQRHDEPVISRAHLAIRSLISAKRYVAPA